jgi:hypothetical protein
MSSCTIQTVGEIKRLRYRYFEWSNLNDNRKAKNMMPNKVMAYIFTSAKSLANRNFKVLTIANSTTKKRTTEC